MLVSGDFLSRSDRLSALGEGTFGSVGLYQTPLGQYVIKETKFSEDSLGYPYDFINEVDAMWKLRCMSTVVTIEGVVFDDHRRKGYILMESLDTNLSRWTRTVPFESRLAQIMPLIYMIGGTLSVMHKFGIIHNDMKTNNILVKYSPSGLFFKLADFGKAKCIGDPVGNYGCIERYKSFYNLNIYNAEFWAFMVVLIEVLIGKRLFEDGTVESFYYPYLKNGRFDLGKFLQRHLDISQYNRIPNYFWDFVDPLLSNRTPDLQISLKRVGIELNSSLISDMERTISKSGPTHPSFHLIEDEFRKRMKRMDLFKYYDRFVSLMNRFLYLVGVEIPEIDLRRYAEVAMVMVTKEKIEHLTYFKDQHTFLLYQRAFFVRMGYQIQVLPSYSKF